MVRLLIYALKMLMNSLLIGDCSLKSSWWTPSDNYEEPFWYES